MLPPDHALENLDSKVTFRPCMGRTQNTQHAIPTYSAHIQTVIATR